MKISVAGPHDASAIAALASRSFLETFAEYNDPADMKAYIEDSFSVTRISADLADSNNTFFVASPDGGEPLYGYAKIRAAEADSSVRGSRPIELERLYLGREALGTGLGARLMRVCLEAAAARGFETMWLGVWERNERAIRFYRRWGFEEVGEHDFMLGGDKQTDLIFERSISALRRL